MTRWIVAIPLLLMLVGCSSDAPPSLTGAWRIVSVGEIEVIPPEGATPELALSSDLTFSASVGCNQIAGTYQLDGLELKFMPGPMTRMACPPPTDQAETAFVEALGQINSFTLERKTLQLKANGETVVELSRSGM